MSSPASSEKSAYLSPPGPDSAGGRPAMVPRRTTTDRTNYSSSASSSPSTSPYNHSKLGPVAGQPRPMRQNSPGYMLNVLDIKKPLPSPRRSPVARDPPSPLGLPEPGDYFGANGAGRGGGGMPRSRKYDDLANESATAAFLAESSSKESGISTTSTSSIGAGAGGVSGDNSFASTATTNSTMNNSAAATTGLKFDESYLGRGGEDSNNALHSSSGSSGSKISRKPSLVGRLLRGGKKKAGQ